MSARKYEIEDGEHKQDVIVSWIITHNCPENCAYCISPSPTCEINKREEHFDIQKRLLETGVSKVRYIGGEPLMIKYILDLIMDAKLNGANTRLSTNGLLLTKELLMKIKDYLNSIAFPLESYNDELNEKIRGTRKHREIIESRIKMIQDVSDMGILINTCVHQENIEYLEELGYYLNLLGIDHWKLRKFSSSSGRGAVINKNRFEISEEVFFQIVQKLQEEYPGLRIDGRLPSKLETRLMISPQGELYRMMKNENENIHYGNILTKKLNIKEIYLRDKCN